MFERPHHQKIFQVLDALDSDLLRQHQCWFGGGTAIALRYGEYRESVDIDFLVSDLDGYRALRQAITGPLGMEAVVRPGARKLDQARDIRADQYGIRTAVRVDSQVIKFEIVLEGRLSLDVPATGIEICGISCLTPLDMAASKLLANSDRGGDDGSFNRDIIDLAMMRPTRGLLNDAVAKASKAYGAVVLKDLEKSLRRLQQRAGWLERCMEVMAMQGPKAVVVQRLRALRKALAPTTPD